MKIQSQLSPTLRAAATPAVSTPSKPALRHTDAPRFAGNSNDSGKRSWFGILFGWMNLFRAKESYRLEQAKKADPAAQLTEDRNVLIAQVSEWKDAVLGQEGLLQGKLSTLRRLEKERDREQEEADDAGVVLLSAMDKYDHALKTLGEEHEKTKLAKAILETARASANIEDKQAENAQLAVESFNEVLEGIRVKIAENRIKLEQVEAKRDARVEQIDGAIAAAERAKTAKQGNSLMKELDVNLSEPQSSDGTNALIEAAHALEGKEKAIAGDGKSLEERKALVELRAETRKTKTSESLEKRLERLRGGKTTTEAPAAATSAAAPAANPFESK